MDDRLATFALYLLMWMTCVTIDYFLFHTLYRRLTMYHARTWSFYRAAIFFGIGTIIAYLLVASGR